MTSSWTDGLSGGTDAEARVGPLVAHLVRLAENEEACRILGVDGTLEDELDVTFLSDPLAWIATEIANAVDAAVLAEAGELDDEDELDAEESGQVSLSTVVALCRLYRILRGGTLDEAELRAAVIQYLEGEDEDELG